MITVNVVSAVDGGRILNQKLARSHVGAVTMGIGMTLLEETVFDAVFHAPGRRIRDRQASLGAR
jgi:CO/xanthine dehydrogenase Mo-binding subunit